MRMRSVFFCYHLLEIINLKLKVCQLRNLCTNSTAFEKKIQPIFLSTCSIQWQIQDFLELGAPTPKVDVKSYYLDKFFPENCMILKEFGPRGGVHTPGILIWLNVGFILLEVNEKYYTEVQVFEADSED